MDAARRFGDKRIRPFADVWDEKVEFPVGCFREAAALGCAGLFAPREACGQGMNALTACLVYEALARCCCIESVDLWR